MTSVDYLIVGASLASVLLIGAWATKRASRNATEFFLSGRTMPWWLLGFSMVACTFSCDTPNLVTDLVRTHGVSGNWVWWAFLVTGMLTVFVYAKLWRRSELATDVGFYEIRYSGTPAKVLRGFRAIYLGFVFDIIIMGTVSLAAIKLGGFQLQLNTVNAETLRDAQEHPEKYPQLIVRIWGWSAYFVELDRAYQNHVIARTEYAL